MNYCNWLISRLYVTTFLLLMMMQRPNTLGNGDEQVVHQVVDSKFLINWLGETQMFHLSSTFEENS